MTSFSACLTLVGCACSLAVGVDADTPRRFIAPADAGLIDVTQAPYHAIPNDGRDDTAAIQRALDDHPNRNAVIYLPDGVYTITDTLRWPDSTSGSQRHKRTHLQGQSTEGTVLRVPDAHRHFGNPEQPRAVVWTGSKPAQRFRNSLRNLTIDVGSDNPGAIGLQYIASNQGSVRHVDLIAGDNAGLIGLDLGYTDEQGPCLIKDVTIRGFDVGVSARTQVNSITIEGLRLEGQRRVGLSNAGQVISIRRLTSDNAVTAIENLDPNGLITLLESTLTGTGGAIERPAIHNASGAIVVRQTKIAGYGQGIANESSNGSGESAPTGRIDAYVSHLPYHVDPRSVEGDLAGLWRIEVKETPPAPQPPVSAWAGPHQFGGDPTDDLDDTAAVQAAIDSGATVIYFPHGDYGKRGWKIDGDVLIPATVRRVTALEGRIKGDGDFVVVEDAEDPLVIDRVDLLYRRIGVENRTERTVVLSGITFGKKRSYNGTGKGDLFLEDVCGHGWRFDGINVWARQLNPESKTVKIANTEGQFWVLGLKTEMAGTIVETKAGGRTEINGGFIYAQGSTKTTPMFTVVTAPGFGPSSLVASVGETTWNRRNFGTLVHHIRPGHEDIFRRTDDMYPRDRHASLLPLITVVTE